jgi:hypothetical protein
MNLLTPFPFKTKRAVQKKLKFAVGIFMIYVKYKPIFDDG